MKIHLKKFIFILATVIFALACFALLPQARAGSNTDGVQLLPLQFGQVAVSNISTGSVSTTINILNADGSVFMTRTATVAANKTFIFRFQNGGTTSVYSAVVTSSVASSIVSDFQVLLPNNEVGAVFPVHRPPVNVLYTPSARLIPGQAALATVTNITSSTTQFSLTVRDVNGIVVLSESASLNPGQTLSYPFSNTGTANNTYRSVVSTDAANTVTAPVLDTVTANVLFFDKTTGQIRAILAGTVVGHDNIYAGVQLLPQQFGQVAVSNVSTGSVSTTINILNADGSVFMTRTSQVAAKKTFVFRFQNGGTSSVYSAVATSSGFNSTVSDFQVLLPNNEVGAVFIGNDGNDSPHLYTPSARLIPGQAALATVTNTTTATQQFSISVLDGNGIVVVSESASLNPGQTLSYPFSNTGTANNTYRAVVTPTNPSAVTADVMFFDTTTGQIRAILSSNGPPF